MSLIMMIEKQMIIILGSYMMAKSKKISLRKFYITNTMTLNTNLLTINNFQENHLVLSRQSNQSRYLL